MRIVYDAAYYDVQGRSAERSADIAVPLLLSVFPGIRSAVDFGCGVGPWLAALARHGVSDILGLDGGHVRPAQLLIPADRYRSVDLARLGPLGRRYDLAISLEAACHVPPERVELLVDGLVAAAPIVLFAAAVPFQQGGATANQRWPSWWAARFAERGYAAADCLRGALWGDDRVDWWYRQNMVVYVDPEAVDVPPSEIDAPLDRAHPELVTVLGTGPVGVRASAAALRRDMSALILGLGVAARRRLGGRRAKPAPAQARAYPGEA